MRDAVESSRKESISLKSKSPTPGGSSRPSRGAAGFGGIKLKAGLDPYADEREYYHSFV